MKKTQINFILLWLQPRLRSVLISLSCLFLALLIKCLSKIYILPCLSDFDFNVINNIIPGVGAEELIYLIAGSICVVLRLVLKGLLDGYFPEQALMDMTMTGVIGTDGSQVEKEGHSSTYASTGGNLQDGSRDISEEGNHTEEVGDPQVTARIVDDNDGVAGPSTAATPENLTSNSAVNNTVTSGVSDSPIIPKASAYRLIDVFEKQILRLEADLKRLDLDAQKIEDQEELGRLFDERDEIVEQLQLLGRGTSDETRKTFGNDDIKSKDDNNLNKRSAASLDTESDIESEQKDSKSKKKS